MEERRRKGNKKGRGKETQREERWKRGDTEERKMEERRRRKGNKKGRGKERRGRWKKEGDTEERKMEERRRQRN